MDVTHLATQFYLQWVLLASCDNKAAVPLPGWQVIPQREQWLILCSVWASPPSGPARGPASLLGPHGYFRSLGDSPARVCVGGCSLTRAISLVWKVHGTFGVFCVLLLPPPSPGINMKSLDDLLSVMAMTLQCKV